MTKRRKEQSNGDIGEQRTGECRRTSTAASPSALRILRGMEKSRRRPEGERRSSPVVRTIPSTDRTADTHSTKPSEAILESIPEGMIRPQTTRLPGTSPEDMVHPPPAHLPASSPEHIMHAQANDLSGDEGNVPDDRDRHDVDEIVTPCTEEICATNLPGDEPETSDDGDRHDIDEILRPCPEKIREVRDVVNRRVKKFLRWEAVLGMLLTAGFGNFTADQFEAMNDAIDTASSGICGGSAKKMPTYKTSKESLWREIQKFSLPRSRTVFICDTSSPRAPLARKFFVKTDKEEMKDPRDCARIVLPSEWAKVDVRNRSFFQEVTAVTTSDPLHQYSIEDAPVTKQRDLSIMHTLALWVDRNGLISTASIGERVTFLCPRLPETHDNEQWLPDSWTTTVSTGNPETVQVQGTVGPIWMVTPRVVTPVMPDEPKYLEERECVLWRSLATSNVTVPTHHRNSTEEDGEESEDDQDDLWEYENNMCSSRETRSRRQRKMTFYVPSAHNVDILPGDICVIIRPDREMPEPDMFCLYQASMLGVHQNSFAERLVWIRKPSYDVTDVYRTEDGAKCKPRIESQTTVSSMPIASSGAEYGQHSRGRRDVCGTLQDGSRYFVYRFCLYADGFKQKKSLADTRSVTGCYIMPTGIYLNSRSSSSCTRVVTLCPTGHDVNNVMNVVMDDIIEGTVHGITAEDPDGNEIRIFLDPVTFLGDYPAVTASMDALGHTANAFCTLCSMSKRKGSRSGKVLYTSNIHSRRMAFSRFKARLDAIRTSGIHARVLRKSGLTGLSQGDVIGRPLVRLERGLEDGRHRIPLTSLGNRVVPGIFDSSLNTAAAPDHLMTGLIKNALTFCFKILPSDGDRKWYERQILKFMKANGLPTENQLLRWDKSGKCKGLHSLTMTSLFCTLLVSSHVFRDKYGETHGSDFAILTCLQYISSILFWTPTTSADGRACLEFVDRGQGRVYLSSLKDLAERYVAKLRSLYMKHGKVGLILDKPNVHRLLELCVHTIPVFGHAKHVTELVLENAHQSFKAWLEKNSHSDAHLSGMDRTLRRDFLSRIATCKRKARQRGSQSGPCTSNRDVLSMILGKEINFLARHDGLSAEQMTSLENTVDTVLQPPVSRFLSIPQLNGENIANSVNESHWEGKDKERNGTWKNLVSDGMRMLQGSEKCTGSTNDDGQFDSQFIRYDRARYIRRSSSGRSNVYLHDIVRPEDVVQVILDTPLSAVLRQPTEEDSTKRYFFVVLGIFGKKGSHALYAVVRRLNHCQGPDGYEDVHEVSEGEEQVLPMTGNVRRAGVIHVCERKGACRMKMTTGSTQQCGTLMTGGKAVILGREAGYPPHMG